MTPMQQHQHAQHLHILSRITSHDKVAVLVVAVSLLGDAYVSS